MAQAKTFTQSELDQVLRYVSTKNMVYVIEQSFLPVSGLGCVVEKSPNLRWVTY